MALRHRALARLNRHVPHVDGADDRVLARRVADRDAERDPGPAVSSEILRSRSEVHERSLRGPQAGPNAPLLIRLVRSPYALHPVRAGRRPDTARPDVRSLHPAERESAPRIRDVLADERPAIVGTRPERPQPELPPRPFRRLRAGADEDAWTVPLEAR